MARCMDTTMEKSLIKLVNDYLYDAEVYIEDYQKFDFYIYNQSIVKEILRICKFKDIGDVFKYSAVLPQPDSIDVEDILADSKLSQRIFISKKLNSVAYINADRYCIRCSFLIDVEYLKKFSKKTKKILSQDSKSNMFSGVNFDCDTEEFMELSDSMGDSTKQVEIIKKKVVNENLVFDETSVINEVMNDICLFFKKDTEKLYEKLHLAYKRGIILYGDPGNGKSAMIRQIIRIVPDVTKIIINPNIRNVTQILHALTKSLDGKKAIIIIEDIDSLINGYNRSEFLNILDGVEIKSGFYFIGTTNYPEKIDPAFMNRSGRFDRTYKIDNPSEETRRIYYKSRKLGKLFAEYKVYDDENKPNTKEDVVEVFVQNSDNLPMACLKELITSVSYILIGNPDMSIEQAVKTSYSVLTTSRETHKVSHNNYTQSIIPTTRNIM